MSEIKLVCIGSAVFKAATEQDKENLKRFKLGDVMTAKVSRDRNPKFLRKFFVLLGVGFEAFEPVVEWKGEVLTKNFEKFREDVTIVAGYYDLVPTLNGDPRAVAKSISFANMEEDEFEKLYNSVVNVLLERVLTNYTRDDVDNVVNQILGFS